ncbi:DCD2B protein, partial [Indicator maculatus]|nr:DCD2B protein [Indicator maculatus]
MSSLCLAGAPPAKTVVVYRNGDLFFPGRRFVVNQKHFLTFEVFLNEVTKRIQAPLAVRNLYTARHGHRVAELQHLQDGCQYVAAGLERFQKLEVSGDVFGEGNFSMSCPTGTIPSCPLPVALLPTLSCRSCGSGHALGCSCCSVFRNGDLLSPPFPLPVSRSSPLQWDTLLATLTEKVTLQCGAVHRLCRLDGTQVCSGEELVNGHYYVAVGNEEYKKLPYLELLVPQGSRCRTLWYVD